MITYEILGHRGRGHEGARPPETQVHSEAGRALLNETLPRREEERDSKMHID